ncbi:LOW QUALITY PROTEIN: Exo_endo_phos domain-containing protein/DUF4283 domain-containing protein, partial [Cephalotus follicularis]
QKLAYIAPVECNGELMAEMPEEILVEGAKEWEHAFVGFFVGKKIPFRSLFAVLNKKWSSVGKFTIHTAENGIFIFKYESEAARDWILNNGPWDVWGVHLALRLWERDLPPISSGFAKIPVWVKLMNIPMEYWTVQGLSRLASVLGSPLHMDPAMEGKQLISFARICVEMKADKEFPAVIKTRRSNGEVVEVKVEYSWRPPVCDRCKVFDHSTRVCPLKPGLRAEVQGEGAVPDPEGWVEVKGKGKEKTPVEGTSRVPTLKPALKNQGSYVPPRNVETPSTPDKGKAVCADPDTATPEVSQFALKIKNIEGQLKMDPIYIAPKTSMGVNLLSGSSSSRKKRKKKSLPTGKTCWNIRGFNDPIKQREVKSLILKHNVAFMGVLETRVRAANKDKVARKIGRGWKLIANHSSLLGRIWILWNPSAVQFTVEHISHQAIHGRLIVQGYEVFVSVVYGSCDYRERRELWANLVHLSSRLKSMPWIVIGDYNVSRWPNEHSGRRSVFSKAMSEFGDCIRKCEIEDLRQTGCFFSWSNKRVGDEAVSKKLDRATGNWGWFKEFNHVQASFPTPGLSDHSPCILQFKLACRSGSRPFKYLNVWASHPEFLDVVRHVWAQSVEGNPLEAVSKKLRLLKPALKEFHKRHFNNLTTESAKIK